MLYYKSNISGPPYNGTEAYEGDSPVIIYLEDLHDPYNPQFELNGLSNQNKYYFVLTAFDSELNESNYSNEVVAPSVNRSSDFGEVGHTELFSNISTRQNRRAMPYTMPEGGSVTAISMYHEAGSGKMLLGLYADDGNGNPGSRLAVTAPTTVSTQAGWQTVDLTTAVFVAAGKKIWLAWVYEKNPGIRYETGTPGRSESGANWSGGMPNSFGASSIEGYIYSIYANYNTGN